MTRTLPIETTSVGPLKERKRRNRMEGEKGKDEKLKRDNLIWTEGEREVDLDGR